MPNTSTVPAETLQVGHGKLAVGGLVNMTAMQQANEDLMGDLAAATRKIEFLNAELAAERRKHVDQDATITGLRCRLETAERECAELRVAMGRYENLPVKAGTVFDE
jgi:hypothetical protein